MEENSILTAENPSTSSSPFNPPSRIICRVCQKQFSQYTCPRCNLRYCSLPCYKSHSLRCTESFMRDNVVEEMRQMLPDDESKRKMLDILKRFHSEDDMDSMDEDDATLSEETVQKVLSGSEISYDDLTEEEKKMFQRAVASGELSKMIEPWEPWWSKPSAKALLLSQEGTQLVQPLAKSEPEESKQEPSDIPPGPETSLPPLKKLSSAEPSPLLAVHLVDILYSYCFTLRLYNGDWKSDALGSSMVVLSLSLVLGLGGQPETVPEVLSFCLEQTCTPAYRHMGGLQFGFGLLDDVVKLLSLGKAALVCLLCDLQRLMKAADEALKLENQRKLKRTEIRSKLKLAERKVYFITCWVNEQPVEAWPSLAAIVSTERASAMEYLRKPMKIGDKPKRTSKMLIEEVQ
ncbi:Shq1 protein domain [Dillenia turbinata]|uniref:Shq1 protein domain n=1 Tax=Dillenia turbinata TaxID=194707 RepID=A0AAN8VPP9_9MAGN